MTTTREGVISYEGLPINSGGAHGLRGLKSLDAWRKTLHFTGTCTTTTTPRRVILSLNHDATPEQEALRSSLIESAVAQLGLHPSPHDRSEYPGKGSSLSWRLDPQRVEDAVAWHGSLGALPTNWLGGPAQLGIDFRLRFKASPDGPELPYQDSSSYLGQAYDGYGAPIGESGCLLTLSSKCSLSVLFSLPFEEPGEELWQYAAFLQSHLPFRFSERHWRHWRLTKKKTSYVGRKIKEPVLP